MVLRSLGYPIHSFIESVEGLWREKSRRLDRKAFALIDRVKKIAFCCLKGLGQMLLRVFQLTALGACCGAFIGGMSGVALAVIVALNQLAGAVLKVALIRLISYIVVSSIFFSIHGLVLGLVAGLAIGLLIAGLEAIFFLSHRCYNGC